MKTNNDEEIFELPKSYRILGKIDMPEGFKAIQYLSKFGLQADIIFPDGKQLTLCQRNGSEPFDKFLYCNSDKQRAHIAIQYRDSLK